eukprot:3757948-Prymnesium_polylepis.1
MQARPMPFRLRASWNAPAGHTQMFEHQHCLFQDKQPGCSLAIKNRRIIPGGGNAHIDALQHNGGTSKGQHKARRDAKRKDRTNWSTRCRSNALAKLIDAAQLMLIGQERRQRGSRRR